MLSAVVLYLAVGLWYHEQGWHMGHNGLLRHTGDNFSPLFIGREQTNVVAPRGAQIESNKNKTSIVVKRMLQNSPWTYNDIHVHMYVYVYVGPWKSHSS